MWREEKGSLSEMLEINKIYNMDCLEGMRLLEKESVDLIITSPPYWVGKNYEKGITFEEHCKLLEMVFKEVSRVLKSNGRFVLNYDDIATYGGRVDKFPYEKMMSGIYEQYAHKNGLYIRNRRIWVKDPTWMTNPYVSGKSDRSLAEFEYLITYAKPKTKGKRRIDLQQYKDWAARGVWYIPSVRKNNDHPAKFPIEIPIRFILMHTDINDIVLDPFMGSGTTAIACINTNRQYIGFELDKHYCDIANERIQKALAEKVVSE